MFGRHIRLRPISLHKLQSFQFPQPNNRIEMNSDIAIVSRSGNYLLERRYRPSYFSCPALSIGYA